MQRVCVHVCVCYWHRHLAPCQSALQINTLISQLFAREHTSGIRKLEPRRAATREEKEHPNGGRIECVLLNQWLSSCCLNYRNTIWLQVFQKPNLFPSNVQPHSPAWITCCPAGLWSIRPTFRSDFAYKSNIHVEHAQSDQPGLHSDSVIQRSISPALFETL